MSMYVYVCLSVCPSVCQSVCLSEYVHDMHEAMTQRIMQAAY